MELKQRKNLRLQSFDYSSAKYYFVTICTKNRASLFGQIVGNGLDRSESSLQPIAKMQWMWFGIMT